MNALLALILIGSVGFVFGQLLYTRAKPGSWLQRFFLSGTEFVLVGALMGPYGLRILDHTTMSSLEPFLALALSWIGLLVGAQLRVANLIRFPLSYFRVAFTESATAMLIAFALLGAVLWWFAPESAGIDARLRAALCLASVIALSSPSEAAVHAPHSARTGHPAGLLRFVSAFAPLVALAAVVILFGVWHVTEDVTGATDLSPILWIVASILGGWLLGAVFLLLLRTTTLGDETVLVVLGMAIFIGGLASVFHLSPLVVSLSAGMVIGNLAPRHEALVHLLLRMERPIYVMLLVLAGALWRFDQPAGYLITLLLIAVRIVSKFGSARLAIGTVRLPYRVGKSWWLGLLPQGAMSVAIAVSYYLVYRDPLSDAVFSAVLVASVALTWFSGPLFERALVVDEDAS